MTDVAALIADMVRAGVDPDLIGRTAQALAEREPVAMPDEQAERRRAKDRERKQAKRLRNSAESADIAELTPSSSLSSPTPPANPSPSPTTHKENPPIGGQKKASRLPADWALPEDWRADALKAGLPADLIDREAEKIRDWSVNSAKGAKVDWRAAWRNWCREAADRQKLARGSPPKQPTLSAAFGQLARNMDAANVSAHHPEPPRIAVLDVPFRPRS